MASFEGPSSTDKSRVLMRGCSFTMSRRVSSSTMEGRPERGLSTRLISPSLKRLNQLDAVRRSMTPLPSTAQISSAAAFAVSLSSRRNEATRE